MLGHLGRPAPWSSGRIRARPAARRDPVGNGGPAPLGSGGGATTVLGSRHHDVESRRPVRRSAVLVDPADDAIGRDQYGGGRGARPAADPGVETGVGCGLGDPVATLAVAVGAGDALEGPHQLSGVVAVSLAAAEPCQVRVPATTSRAEFHRGRAVEDDGRVRGQEDPVLRCSGTSGPLCGDYRVRVEIATGSLALSVFDRGPSSVPREWRSSDERGRGLDIVVALAAAYDVVIGGKGRRAWRRLEWSAREQTAHRTAAGPSPERKEDPGPFGE